MLNNHSNDGFKTECEYYKSGQCKNNNTNLGGEGEEMEVARNFSCSHLLKLGYIIQNKNMW